MTRAAPTSLNYNHLFYFYRVADHGSLSSAARELGVTQPTVSSQIRSLEKQMGQDLFRRRSGGALELTHHGQQAFEHARKMFAESDRLLASLAEPEGQEIVIVLGVAPQTTASFMATLFLPLLENLRLRPRLGFAGHDTLMRRLAREEIELAVSDRAPSPSSSDEMSSTLLYSPRMIAVSSKRVKEKLENFPEGLTETGIVQYTAESSVRSALDIYLAERGPMPKVWLESDDVLLQLEAVREGFGVAFVPENMIDTPATQDLCRLGFAAEVRMTVYGIYRERQAAEHVMSALAALTQGND